MERDEVERRLRAAECVHGQGYNCAQSVICSTCDLAGIDRETAFRLAEGLGGGLGNHREVCGCISGGALAFGAMVSAGLGGPVTKHRTYRLSAALVDAFRDEYGCTACVDLLGLPHSCDEYIAFGVEQSIRIMEEWKSEHGE